MIFPALVYISPGGYIEHKTQACYGITVALDKDHLGFLLETYSLTKDEAIAKAGKNAFRVSKKPIKTLTTKQKPSKPLVIAKPEKEAVRLDNAPPTRKELEQKATELGIKYDGRWNDKRLASVIAEKV